MFSAILTITSQALLEMESSNGSEATPIPDCGKQGSVAHIACKPPERQRGLHLADCEHGAQHILSARRLTLERASLKHGLVWVGWGRVEGCLPSCSSKRNETPMLHM